MFIFWFQEIKITFRWSSRHTHWLMGPVHPEDDIVEDAVQWQCDQCQKFILPDSFWECGDCDFILCNGCMHKTSRSNENHIEQDAKHENVCL